jgi:hypothetical protein
MLFTVALAVVSHASWLSYRCFTEEMPKPASINLSYFSGRVLPETQVNPGTFSIAEEFYLVNGEDALISFGCWDGFGSVERDSGVRIFAWKPDSKTPTVFRKGKKFVTADELWPSSPHAVAEKVCFSAENKQLLIYPARCYAGNVAWDVIAGFIATVLCFFGCITWRNL